jgi:hypothetical protein
MLKFATASLLFTRSTADTSLTWDWRVDDPSGKSMVSPVRNVNNNPVDFRTDWRIIYYSTFLAALESMHAIDSNAGNFSAVQTTFWQN